MSALRLHRQLDAIWRSAPGWRGVVTSVSHSDIGRRFIVAAFVFFAIGGVLAMLIRAQLASPRSAFIGPQVFNQLFTMHGSIMMFLFAIPLLEGLAMYMLPKILGTRDMAYPRLSALGWWCYVIGGTVLVGSLLAGVAPNGGWFMYTPLSGKAATPGIHADVWLLGVTFVEVSAVCAAVEITVSILKLRAPGMALTQMPLLAWYLLGAAAMMVVGFPPLILGSILLEVERAFNWPFFDVARGGDPMLWQHLFWLFGHPEVYIIFLPAAGVISTMLPVLARTRIVGYGGIVAAIFAMVFLSFGLWVHHMFTTGIPHMGLALFSAASVLVAVPTAVQLFAWIGTLAQGRPQWTLPMWHLLGFAVTFVMGGLTGVMLAVVPFDWQAHDTAFVTAHLHYVLMGGFVFPMLAAAYYWLPLLTGRQGQAILGRAAFWLIFVGFHATFLLMHLLGLLGMPRRVDTYGDYPGWAALNLLSSVGGFVMAIGFALFAIDLLWMAWLGRRTPRNPWDAHTLEWATPLPPPSYNFASLPHVNGRDALAQRPELPAQLARGEGYLGAARQGWRETLAVDVGSGRVEQLVVLTGNSALPLTLALAIGSFFALMLMGWYAATPLALLLVVALAWRWAWGLGQRRDWPALPVGMGTEAPLHTQVPRSTGWWGSAVTLVADGTLFTALCFGYGFLWVVAPNWPPPSRLSGAALPALLGAGALLLAWGLAIQAGAAARAGRLAAARGWLLGQLGALSAAALMAGWLLLRLPPPTGHADAAASGALLVYLLAHLGIAALMAAFGWARIGAGFVAGARQGELAVARMWQAHATVTGLIALALVALPEWLA